MAHSNAIRPNLLVMRFSVALLLFLAVVSVAASEPSADLVRVWKSERKLEVISGGKVTHEFKVALGGSPKGHKTKEGDRKTPEGKYALDYKKPDSAFYKAIHISYPNANDISQARTHNVLPGGQVMIHGQKNGLGWLSFITQHFDWTSGCIALTNSDMDILWPLVREGTTVEILP